MNSPEIELEEAFGNDDIVVACWEPGCTMHRLPDWSQEKWVVHEQQKGYRNYSHGICVWHYHLYQKKIERFIAEEAVCLESAPRVAAVAVG